MCDIHGLEDWNDHAVAYTDTMARKRMEEREKAKKAEIDGSEGEKDGAKEVQNGDEGAKSTL